MTGRVDLPFGGSARYNAATTVSRGCTYIVGVLPAPVRRFDEGSWRRDGEFFGATKGVKLEDLREHARSEYQARC